MIGPIPISKGHAVIKELIRSSKIGDLQRPVRLAPDTVIIFKLESLRKATLDEPTRLSLGKELFGKWLDEQSILFIKSLKVKYGLIKK